MKDRSQLLTKMLWCSAVLAVAWLLTACAISPKTVSHSFSFDGWFDGWAKQVDLLEYSYGDQYHMVRRKAKDTDSLGYSSGVNGPMPVGEFLYVKWRVKETGELVEDRVDLRGKLPSNMFEHGLTFAIDGKQLYVYLITREARDSRQPKPLKTFLSRYNVTYELYPQNTYKR